MVYIYDILVNFCKNDLLEFYEWNSSDEVINIKKIKLFRIDSKKLNDLIEYNCTISDELLSKIYHTCELYNKNKNSNYEYTCLLSDGNRVVAFVFNKNGNIISRSKLLLEEENEISILAANLELYNIKYKKMEKTIKEKFLTRLEKKIYNYLYKEINSSYTNKEYSKLKYLYQEYYDRESNSIIDMYNRLINSLKSINDKHKYIYDLLIKIKKQV